MTIWLGPPGFLQALPSVGRGIGRQVALPGESHARFDGSLVRDRVGTRTPQSYTMSRSRMTADEWGVVEGLALGAYGQGPFVLLDPWRRNLLTANQSTGSEVLADTTGFWTNGVGTIVSNAVAAGVTSFQGFRRVRWTVPNGTGASSAIFRTLDTSSTAAIVATGIPVLPLTAYAFQATVSGGGAGPWLSLRADLLFYDATGALLSTTGGSTVAINASWQTVSSVATSPATAAYVGCRLVNLTVPTADVDLYVDALQLEIGSSGSAWVPGTGVPRVAFDSFSETYNYPGEHDCEWSLVEVG